MFPTWICVLISASDCIIQRLTTSKLLTASLAKWLRRPPRKRKVRSLNPACDGIFLGWVIPVTSKLALQWLPCQAPCATGSVLGLVGPESVYGDWARWKVGSATSISVWQHAKLSEQIRPWDTLACFWDVKQPTNKQNCKATALQVHGLGQWCASFLFH